MIDINNLVKKLVKKEQYIYTILDINNIIDPTSQDYFNNGDLDSKIKISPKTYKTVSILRKNNILTPIKNGLFYIQKDKSNILDKQEILSEYYWHIIHKLISSNGKQGTWIGGKKSLEIWINDFYEPEKLTIYNRNITKSIKFDIHEVCFKKKSILSKKNSRYSDLISNTSTNKKGFLSLISKNIVSKKIKNLDFNIANKELAILEYLLISDKNNNLDINVIKKFLKKYNNLDRNILGDLVSFRYISSINRLREISKQLGYEDLYNITLDIINKEGKGCFLSFII